MDYKCTIDYIYNYPSERDYPFSAKGQCPFEIIRENYIQTNFA